ncbi:hypothetical protein [Stakelama tenebrarum]|uniref:Uncharacterized protein n=1 Tax=Stakelama tenebrarum TaxID=2711215 RepID=A0A6G6Y5T7_9SPHN|nr:hypothetical protein [Sphingosinithalassobacter tenebrarum]QIG79953.1 hypothetical protein G5C33_09310 [Sphingosinithalassobacter tenebrarum]
MTPGTNDIGDWPALRATAERIRDDRARSDPAAVEAGRMTKEAARARVRVADALATLWQCVAEHRDIPELAACDAEIRADLATARAAAERVSAARPDHVPLALHAARIATLAHYHAPYRAGAHIALIRFLHACNQQARVDREPRRAAA